MQHQPGHSCVNPGLLAGLLPAASFAALKGSPTPLTRKTAARFLSCTGGWVPLSGAPTFPTPSKDVMFFNNLVINPSNASAQWAHFSVSAWDERSLRWKCKT